MDVDCGFFGESALLTLACIGAAALLVEGYAFCLGRRLAEEIKRKLEEVRKYAK